MGFLPVETIENSFTARSRGGGEVRFLRCLLRPRGKVTYGWASQTRKGTRKDGGLSKIYNGSFVLRRKWKPFAVR